jgi:hypothetical protein
MHLKKLFMDFSRFSMMIAAFFLASLSVICAQNIPTPPGVPVPVEALYGGPDNILQWYQVLSSDASPAACTALTNARQTTDAALKPLTPWVLGKLSTNGAAPSAFNISVSSTDSSVLVLKTFAGVTALQLKLVNVNTTTPGTTTLILTNADTSVWNLVWMLSTSSSQPASLYTAKWTSFNSLMAPNAFPNQVNTVTQGSPTCNYPPGVSPSYVNADIQK